MNVPPSELRRCLVEWFDVQAPRRRGTVRHIAASAVRRTLPSILIKMPRYLEYGYILQHTHQPAASASHSATEPPCNLDYYISVLNLPIHLRRPPLRPLDLEPFSRNNVFCENISKFSLSPSQSSRIATSSTTRELQIFPEARRGGLSGADGAEPRLLKRRFLLQVF
jgi:hypothetical protein